MVEALGRVVFELEAVVVLPLYEKQIRSSEVSIHQLVSFLLSQFVIGLDARAEIIRMVPVVHWVKIHDRKLGRRKGAVVFDLYNLGPKRMDRTPHVVVVAINIDYEQIEVQWNSIFLKEDFNVPRIDPGLQSLYPRKVRIVLGELLCKQLTALDLKTLLAIFDYKPAQIVAFDAVRCTKFNAVLVCWLDDLKDLLKNAILAGFREHVVLVY